MSKYDNYNSELEKIKSEYDDGVKKLVNEMEQELIDTVFAERRFYCFEEDTATVDVEESYEYDRYIYRKSIIYVEYDNDIIYIYYGKNTNNEYKTFHSLNFEDAYGIYKYLKNFDPKENFENCFKIDIIEVFEVFYKEYGDEYFKEHDIKEVYNKWNYYMKEIPKTYYFQKELLTKYPEMYLEIKKKYGIHKDIPNDVPEITPFEEGEGMGFFSIH